MLVQDTLTGYFHEVPDSQLYVGDFGEFPEQIGEGQVVYDGFGNPVGLLPALLPVASALVPAAAGLVRGLFRRRRRRPPSAPQPMVPPPPVMVAPPPPTPAMMPESVPAEETPMGQVVYDGLGNPVGIAPFIPAIASLASRALPAVARAIPAVARALPAVARAAPGVQSLVRGLLPGGIPVQGAMRALAPIAQGALPQRQPWRPPWPQGWIRPPLPYTGLGPRRLYMRCAVWPGPRGLVPVSAAQAQVPAVAPVPPAAAMAQMRRRRFRRRRR
jgi:hypothetical protein